VAGNGKIFDNDDGDSSDGTSVGDDQYPKLGDTKSIGSFAGAEMERINQRRS
jgi:hypothetical protein